MTAPAATITDNVQRRLEALWPKARQVVALDGPLVRRICLEDGDSTIWIEIPQPGGPFHPLLPLIDVVAASRERRSQFDFLRFPDMEHMARDGWVVHRLPRSTSFFEILQGESPWGVELNVFADVGGRLAELHSASIGEAVTAAAPCGPVNRPMTRLHSADGAADSLAPLRKALCVCPQLPRQASLAESMLSEGGALLHGRWSMGSLLLKAGEPETWMAMTGIDICRGPAEYDAGYLLAELLEVAADGRLRRDPATVRQAMAAASSFVAGYSAGAPLDPAMLALFIAHRMVTHVLLNAVWQRANLPQQAAVEDWIRGLTVIEACLNEFGKCLQKN